MWSAGREASVGGVKGYDGHKKVRGRKRHIVVDTLGWLLAVTVTAADVDDGAAAPVVLGKLRYEKFPRLAKLWGDNKYHNHSLSGWLAVNAWYGIEVVSRPEGAKEFRPLPFRWAVERTFAWLGRCRIHSREYERLPSSSESQVQISMIQLMLRRLARTKYEHPFRYKRPRRKRTA